MKKLLFSVTKKDLNISFFSGTGAGGQHRNKHMNCVRMYHKPSGASATGQSNRNRKSNLVDALHGIAEHPKFKMWANKMVFLMEHQETIEERVNEAMRKEYLKVECESGNEWKECEELGS